MREFEDEFAQKRTRAAADWAVTAIAQSVYVSWLLAGLTCVMVKVEWCQVEDLLKSSLSTCLVEVRPGNRRLCSDTRRNDHIHSSNYLN